MKIPHGYVPVGAAGEADLGVGADGQSIAGGRRRGQLSLDPRGRRRKIPDGQGARFAPDDEGPPVREQPTGPDVVISVLIGQKRFVSTAKGGGGGTFRMRRGTLTRQSSWDTGVLLPGWLMSHTLTQPLPPV